MAVIINKIVKFLVGNTGIILWLSVLTTLFVSLVVLSVLGRVRLKEKLYFLIFGCSLSLIYLATSFVLKTTPYIAIFMLGLSGIFLSILLFIDRKLEDGAKELIKQIDREIKNETPTPLFPIVKDAPIVEKKEFVVREQPKRELDVDFSHVKSILERLDYYSLSNQDKRTVCELESLLVQAERGDGSRELKEKINDGLSSLLKIMSKYGV